MYNEIKMNREQSDETMPFKFSHEIYIFIFHCNVMSSNRIFFATIQLELKCTLVIIFNLTIIFIRISFDVEEKTPQ